MDWLMLGMNFAVGFLSYILWRLVVNGRRALLEKEKVLGAIITSLIEFFSFSMMIYFVIMFCYYMGMFKGYFSGTCRCI